MRLNGRRQATAATAYPSPYTATAPPQAAPPVAPQAAAEPQPQTRRLTPFGFWLSAVLVSLVVAVVGAGIAFAIVRAEPARYASTATLIIDQPGVLAQTTDAGEIGKLLALRVKYADYATTLAFADGATSGTNISPQAMHAGVTTSVPADSLLFAVGGQAGDPGEAQAIAGNASQALVRYAQNEMTSLGIKKNDQVTLKVVTPPGPAAKIAPSSNREIGAGGFVGAVLFVLTLSLQALRRRFG